MGPHSIGEERPLKKQSIKPKNLVPIMTKVLRIPTHGNIELIQLDTIPSFSNFSSKDESDAHLLHVPNATRFWRHLNYESFHTAWYARTVIGCVSQQKADNIAGVYYVMLNKTFKDLPMNEHVCSGSSKDSYVYGDVFIFRVADQSISTGPLGEAVYEDVSQVFVDSGEAMEMLKFAAKNGGESEMEYLGKE